MRFVLCEKIKLKFHVTVQSANGGARSIKFGRAQPAGAPNAARCAWRMAPGVRMWIGCAKRDSCRAMQRLELHAVEARWAFQEARSVT